MKKLCVISFLLFILTSCDPTHDLHLENQTGEEVAVIYHPALSLQSKKSDIVIVGNRKMHQLTLSNAEKVSIGTVTASYQPSAHDVDLEYLEITYSSDTIKLVGKRAILSAIQKIDNLDWRLIVK